MNERQIDLIQRRIAELCSDYRGYRPAAVNVEIASLRWVLTDVCGVTPWIVPLICALCGCTNEKPCTHPNGQPCSWAQFDPPTCSLCLQQTLSFGEAFEALAHTDDAHNVAAFDGASKDASRRRTRPAGPSLTAGPRVLFSQVLAVTGTAASGTAVTGTAATGSAARSMGERFAGCIHSLTVRVTRKPFVMSAAWPTYSPVANGSRSPMRANTGPSARIAFSRSRCSAGLLR